MSQVQQSLGRLLLPDGGSDHDRAGVAGLCQAPPHLPPSPRHVEILLYCDLIAQL